MSFIFKLHWIIPSTILGCLVLGLATAIGHHWLYQHVQGTIVGSEVEQRWITRAGTAMAFMFKMFIAIATGSAYTQQLWLTLSERPAKIEHIDGMFGALTDATGLVNVGLWDPWLTMTAIVFWAIPIVAIITPGTIAIQSQYHLVTQNLQVPTLNYTGTTFSDDLFSGPSSEVQLTSLMTAFQGSILPMQPQYLNSSYKSQIFMPAMQCKSWEAEHAKEFARQKCNYFASDNCPESTNNPESANITKPFLEYLSWTRSEEEDPNHIAPFEAAAHQSTSDTRFTYTGGRDRQFYIHQLNSTSGVTLGPDILISCEYSNASYTINFSFEDGKQDIQILEKSFRDLTTYAFADETMWDPIGSYESMVSAFDNLLVGYIWYENFHSGPETVDDYKLGFAYVALTQIHNTRISPQKQTFRSAKEFGDKVEELFTNMTISYLSNSALVTNSSHSPSTDVTMNVHQIVYTYNAKDLWRAYGIGLGAAIICALIGFRAMNLNKGAFRLSWSTVFRTTRSAELDRLLTDESVDLNGAHPVPGRIKQATLLYTKSGFKLHGSVEYDSDYG